MLFRALVRANSLDPDLVEAQVKAADEITFFGRIRFTPYGQLDRPPNIVQYDQSNQLQIVFPDDAKTMEYVYPAPSFSYRDCLEVLRIRGLGCLQAGRWVECCEGFGTVVEGCGGLWGVMVLEPNEVAGLTYPWEDRRSTGPRPRTQAPSDP